jgi:hypothetical protein
LLGYWALIVNSIVYRLLLLELKAKWYAGVSLIILPIKIAIVILMVSVGGYLGAAVSITITQIIMTVLLWLGMSKSIRGIIPGHSLVFRVVLTSLLCGILTVLNINHYLSATLFYLFNGGTLVIILLLLLPDILKGRFFNRPICEGASYKSEFSI